MVRCVIEWGPSASTAVDAGGASTSASQQEHEVAFDLSAADGDTIDMDPPRTLCERAHGERVKVTFTTKAAGSQYLVRLTSTARLAEVFRGRGRGAAEYNGTATGIVAAADEALAPQLALYTIELPLDGAAVLQLKLAGIKGPFILRRIQVAPVTATAAASNNDAGEARAAAAATMAPPQTQQLAELLALAQSPPSEPADVPEGLRELFGKMSAAPDSAQAAAIKQMAQALARGVMLGPPTGAAAAAAAGGGGAGGQALAAATAAAGEQEDRRRRIPQHQEVGHPPPPPASDDTTTAAAPDAPTRLLLAAIERSEARVLAAVDALARRVGALETAVATMAAAAAGGTPF